MIFQILRAVFFWSFVFLALGQVALAQTVIHQIEPNLRSVYPGGGAWALVTDGSVIFCASTEPRMPGNAGRFNRCTQVSADTLTQTCQYEMVSPVDIRVECRPN